MLESIVRLGIEAHRDFEREFGRKVLEAQKRFTEDALFHARVTGVAQILATRAHTTEADNINWTLLALEAITALEYVDERYKL